jgi:hypothetical protein
MSEHSPTEPMPDEPRPDPARVKPGSEQVVGDDETEYGGAGTDGDVDPEGENRGPREEDEDQGVH